MSVFQAKAALIATCSSEIENITVNIVILDEPGRRLYFSTLDHPTHLRSVFAPNAGVHLVGDIEPS